MKCSRLKQPHDSKIWKAGPSQSAACLECTLFSKNLQGSLISGAYCGCHQVSTGSICCLVRLPFCTLQALLLITPLSQQISLASLCSPQSLLSSTETRTPLTAEVDYSQPRDVHSQISLRHLELFEKAVGTVPLVMICKLLFFRRPLIRPTTQILLGLVSSVCFWDKPFASECLSQSRICQPLKTLDAIRLGERAQVCPAKLEADNAVVRSLSTAAKAVFFEHKKPRPRSLNLSGGSRHGL